MMHGQQKVKFDYRVHSHLHLDRL